MQLPQIPEGCQSNYHMFYVITENLRTRDALIAYLKEQGIGAVFHYVPLHTAPVGQRFGYRAGDLPVTEDLSNRLVRLPFYHGLLEKEQTDVVSHITRFANTHGARKAA
jgi:dTDP-4-amino-4,6-dideoxygalactose transaminase